MSKKLVFLKTDVDFSNFKRSKLVSTKNIRLRTFRSVNQNFCRFGFIIPKKVVKNVTDRNLIKRRFKSILLKHLDPIKPFDLLFFPNLSVRTVKYKDLEQEVLVLLNKAGVYVVQYSTPNK